MARYFAGVTFHDLGDNTSAEKDLKQVSDSRYKEIASLAKVALAAVYHDTNHNLQASRALQAADRSSYRLGRQEHGAIPLGSLYEVMAG